MRSGGPTPNRDTYLYESVSPEGLFGNSLEATQAKFEQKKESVSSIVLVLNVKSKQPMGAHKCPPTKHDLLRGQLHL